MSHNPILEDLHAARQKLLAEAGGDLHRYVEEAKRRTLASGRVIVEPKQPAAKQTSETRSESLRRQEASAAPLDR